LALEDLVGVEGMPLAASDMQARLVDPAAWQVVLDIARGHRMRSQTIGSERPSDRHRSLITAAWAAT
jgi:hypothetical protein